MLRALVLSGLFLPSLASAATLNVCSTCTYTTISSAVTAAASGDTVAVAAGSYSDKITLKKTITLQGAGSGSTTLTGTANDAIQVNGSGTITVSGFTIVPKSGGDRAVDIGGGATVTLSDIAVSSFSSTADGVGVRAHDSGTTVTINGSSFKSLKTTGNGGGVYAASGSTLSVGTSTFDSNSAAAGGAIYTDTGVPLVLTSSTLSSNKASGNGGAVYVSKTTLTMTSDTVTGNSATGTSSVGGGIYFTSSTATITGSTFSSNSATVGGAGYATGATVTISSSTFSGNTATSASSSGGGGALYAASSAAVTLTSDTFSSNTSASYGGALVGSSAGGLTLTSDIFSGNTATLGGAAIAFTSAASVSASKSWFCTNSSSASGGAVWLASVTGTDSWTNNIFVENVAATTGGGLYLTTAASFVNNDFLDNKAASASGGAFYTTSSATLDNNIIAYTAAGDGVHTTSTSGSYKYSDWYSNSATDISGSVTTLDSTNLLVDPGLWSYTPGAGCGGPNENNFHIKYSSSLRDAGDPSYTDPDGSRSDIGAFGGSGSSGFTDADGDGWYSVYDCDDANASIYPGATEVCNSKDDDCDGLVDDGAGTTWYADTDGDGYGTSATSTVSCTAPSGYVSNSSDCDDTSKSISPAATEVCNGVDDDCDGTIDEGVKSTYYKDADGDGYGTSLTTTTGCSAPSGYVTNSSDCDDSSASIKPGATEVCNGVDDDCDGSIDEGVKTTYYRDADGDGYGTTTTTTSACSAPSGYVASATDCDDTASSVHPGATETCNGVDDDCDGTVDEGAGTTWYRDADGDGYGTSSTTATACTAPTGYVSSSTDCDDATASINPGATEVCNGVDDNCNGVVDEGSTFTWYRDADGDGYGDAASTTTTSGCASAPSGYVAASGDCDDTSASINPGATEVCNSKDDDCDGSVDEGMTTTWYADTDGDGYGNASSSTSSCSKPSGYTANNTDCDDTKSSVHPGATETCNGVDDDCDGTVDDGVTTTFYADADGDGYGGTSTTSACSAPSGYVATSTDCDDAAATVHPGAAEACNGVDDDCDGLVDEGVGTTYYKDADGDGYGDASSTTTSCSAPSGYVSNKSDCDDTSAAIKPGATETCNGVDDNCNGTVDEGAIGGTWYADADGDGYGDVSSTTKGCSAPSGYTADATDCDDGDAYVHPGAVEQCNGVDDDCDGTVDDGVVYVDWYADADSDGYGDATTVVNDCVRPSGYTSDATDCDDLLASVNPGATEVCNGIDDDCDGVVDGPSSADAVAWYADTDGDGFGDATNVSYDCSAPSGYVANSSDCDDSDPTVTDGTRWYIDADGDGYGDSSSSVKACSQPSGYVANTSDCDDADAAVNPGAAEVCNGIDDDCDGLVDDGATDATTYWVDADGDGYGDPASTTVTACSRPSGYADNYDDCDDSTFLTSPGAPEQCNGVDDDCDGVVDDGVVYTDWYPDADGDGYGDATGTPVNDCLAPSGYTYDTSDCDDGDASVNPAAVEICNGKDDDCNGVIDDATSGGTTWYADADGDGWGDPATTVTACSAPTGYVSNGLDCDDTDASVGPSGSTWYADVDGDGYGDPTATTSSCTQPAGFVSDSSDCDDGDANVNPAEVEVCNGIDDDCDGTVDDGAVDATTWYVDADNDTYGDPSSTPVDACSRPSGYADNADDCDDTEFNNNPSAPEQCDGVDNDCDGVVDNDVVYTDWYPDADGDGYGDASGTPINDCLAPSGYSYDASDCDDSDAAVNPAAVEVCNGVDDDCDGTVDVGATDAVPWWLDADSDGYGDPLVSVDACEAPAGYVDNPDDCDDSDPTVHDGIVWYADADGDGYGDAGTSITSCTAPSGYVADATDCDDGDATINPAGTEVCNGLDDDCDGTVDDGATDGNTYYVDADNDGFGDPSSATVTGCERPSGYADNGDDCDDTEFNNSPDAPEQCDGVDNDCDGQIDEDVTDTTWYPDADGDGYGDPTGTPVTDCMAPDGYSWDATDCDDTNAAVNPNAVEVCNGIDDDCDGSVDESGAPGTWYVDADGDSWGDDGNTVSACGQPDGTVDRGGDCDDNDPDVYPGAPDVPNDGIDQDCDGNDATDTGDTGDTDTGADTDTDSEDTGAIIGRDGKYLGGGCGGCASGGAGGGASAVLLLVGLVATRRRRRD